MIHRKHNPANFVVLLYTHQSFEKGAILDFDELL